MKQKQHVLSLIQHAGIAGIGSNELRNITHAVDVPKCVSSLRQDGFVILSQDLPDKTVKYFWGNQDTQPISQPLQKKIIGFKNEFYTGADGNEYGRRTPIYE